MNSLIHLFVEMFTIPVTVFIFQPCTECLAGVPECLEVSELFGLTDLRKSCIKWVALLFITNCNVCQAGSVVQRIDNAIYQIDHYLVVSIADFVTLMHWIVIFSAGSIATTFSTVLHEMHFCRWMAKHFDRILGSKGFATLPKQLQAEILAEIQRSFVSN